MGLLDWLFGNNEKVWKRRKHSKRINVVTFVGPPSAIRKLKRLNTYEDGPIPREIKIRVRKGYRLLRRTYKRHEIWLEYIGGKKVVQWVQTYFADDAEGDDFQPVIQLSRRRVKR